MFFKKLFNKIVCALGIVSSSQSALQINQQAPEFSLVDDAGNIKTLSSCRGKKVALVFYPKDGSPYCTKQAQTIKERFQELSNHNIRVLGLSADNTEAHKKFKQEYQLPFDLLTATKTVLKLYNADGSSFNKRITFLIDENGKIVHIIDNVDITKHAQQILDGFGIKQ
jgi:thioredoxin-dependent peroxiredoxin